MFRFAIAILAAIGLGSLLFGAGAGWLLLAPLLFIFKIMFFVMLFSMFFTACGRRRPRYGRGPWGWRPTPERSEDRSPSTRQQFEDWHDLQHARKEVDGWVEDAL